MKICYLKNLNKSRKAKIANRYENNKYLSDTVSDILLRVKTGGYIEAKKQVNLFTDKPITSLQVTKNEINSASKLADKILTQALKTSSERIKSVHTQQFTTINSNNNFDENGILIERLWRPIERIGIYVPGGLASYPSSLLMTAIPAKVAGCKEITVCSPPLKDGSLPTQLLAAASIAGVSTIYKIGGATAIACMTYGMNEMEPVNKIFGAGNSYVMEAKKQVQSQVAIDMPAGPSEIFIIADGNANPSYIAADMLADSEHSEDTAAILLSTSYSLAQKVAKELNYQLKNLSTKGRISKALKRHGLVAVVKNLNEATEFCNNYAPEHLEVFVSKPQSLVKKIKNAGTVLIGPWTSKSAADYATGSNHILPTGRNAKVYSSLSIEDFGRLMPVQTVKSRSALSSLRSCAETLAVAEGLPAHANSMRIRFKNNS